MPVELRPYQIEACDNIEVELMFKKSTLLVLPTGVGKTITFAELARRYSAQGQRVLILAHRDELIAQAVDKVGRLVAPDLITIEKADQFADRTKPIVIGGVQTMQRTRLESWPKDHFHLIVIDEAHHASAKTYKNIIAHFETSDLLGVTATPYRQGKDKLADVFQTTAYSMDLWQAIDAGHLCPLKSMIASERIDLTGIRIMARDFDCAALGKVIEANLEKIVRVTLKSIESRRKILAFVPTIEASKRLAMMLRAEGISAEYISGECPDRAEKLARFESGEIRILTNASLLTEGFDCPAVDAVILARPTKSRSLLVQMLGRGMRNSPGKENVLLVDFSWKTAENDLASILEDPYTPGGKVPYEVDEEFDMAEARERSRLRRIFLEAQQRRDRLEMQAQTLRGNNARQTMDLRYFGIKLEINENSDDIPATARQLEIIQNWLRLSWTPTGLTYPMARQILGKLALRRDQGLASPGQVRMLRSVMSRRPPEDIATITFDDAIRHVGRGMTRFARAGAGR
jgi:superfamily II DNA or RNA helicase